MAYGMYWLNLNRLYLIEDAMRTVPQMLGQTPV